ncbi:MAG TPA: O-antigen ligase family protein [Leptospiraceae bacterium]|nr:O-antigen ligase family protein [Leptospiraceae bacterium]HNF12946.1 O-antigen ligase family protein [Leptospiraceae bacterium]
MQISALFLEEFRFSLFFEMFDADAVFLLFLFGFFKYRAKTVEKGLYLLNSLILVSYSSYKGVLFLHETEIPRLSLYFKVYFLFSLIFYLYIILKMKSERTLFWATLILSFSIFNLNYFFSLSFRTVPHLFYVIYSIHYFRKKNDKSKRLALPDISVIFLVFSASLSAFLGVDIFRSVSALSSILCAAGAYFLASSSTANEKKTVQLLFVFQFLSTTAVFLLFIIIRHLFGTVPADDRYLAGFHVNGIGPYITFFFPASMLFALRNSKTLISSVFSVLTASAAVFIVIYCHNRSALAAILISFAAFLFLRKADKSQNKIFHIFTLAASGLITLSASFFLIKYYNAVNLDTFWIRTDIWRIFIAKTLHYSPWTGFGHESYHAVTFLKGDFLQKPDFGTQAGLIRNMGADTHPHNYFFVFLYSGGILALTAFLFACFCTAAETWLRWKKGFGMYGISEVCTFIGILIFGLLDSNLAEPQIQAVILVYFGFYIRRLRAFSFQIKSPFNVIISRSFAYTVIILYLWIFYNFEIFYRKMIILKPYLDFSRYDYIHIRPEVSEEKLKKAETFIHYEFYSITSLNYSLNSEILTLLGEKSNNRQKTEGALIELKKCVKQLPISPYCSRRISEIEERSGNTPEAEHWKEEYRKKDPYHFYKD